LIVLKDPREALPSYDAMLMLSPRVAGDERLARTLEPLIGAISVEAMREANYAVDREDDKKLSPAEAAAALARKIGF
jgi:osmoprotectant transport system permease protein